MLSKLNIVCGDIFNYLDGKDLIVNSSNPYMMPGGGLCGVIYRKSNMPLLTDYCINKYNRKKMKVNEIRITPGFNLGIDILHIYCPKNNEDKYLINELLESYEKIFISAKKGNYKSILSVSLGSGAHNYNHNEIAKDVINKLKELVKEYNIEFTLVLPNEEIKELYS